MGNEGPCQGVVALSVIPPTVTQQETQWGQCVCCVLCVCVCVCVYAFSCPHLCSMHVCNIHADKSEQGLELDHFLFSYLLNNYLCNSMLLARARACVRACVCLHRNTRKDSPST